MDILDRFRVRMNVDRGDVRAINPIDTIRRLERMTERNRCLAIIAKYRLLDYRLEDVLDKIQNEIENDA